MFLPWAEGVPIGRTAAGAGCGFTGPASAPGAAAVAVATVAAAAGDAMLVATALPSSIAVCAPPSEAARAWRLLRRFNWAWRAATLLPFPGMVDFLLKMGAIEPGPSPNRLQTGMLNRRFWLMADA